MQQCRCNREKPPCKYFHPPQHLKDQLLINGRNHLALKNALLTQVPIQPVLPGQLPVATTHPYITSIPTNAMTATTYNPYISQNPNLMPGLIPADPTSAMNAMTCHAMPTSIMSSQKLPRTDRLEVCREFQRGNCKRSENECRFAHPADHVTVDSSDGGMVTVCMDYIKGRCTREQCRYFHPPPHLQAQLKAAQSRANAAAMPQLVETIAVGKKRPREPGDDIFLAFPGMSHYTKRPAMDKSGIPVYQPNTAYQQALAMQLHQPFVPVTLPMLQCSATNLTSSAAANAASISYYDEKGQLRDTLPVCRDFKSGQCKRPQCRYVHLIEDYVEVTDGKVTVCRDAVKGKCTRPLCKYYHIPVLPIIPTSPTNNFI
ncbi:Muscleblind-like protein 1 [Nymphon striatum]|nr:Muscleblind-like protein 1 [Nymphon striatum]